MGSNKLVVFLCLAVLATSIQARSPSTLDGAKIFDDASALLDKLSQAVNDQVEAALSEIQGLIALIGDGKERVIIDLTAAVDGVVKPMVDKLNNRTEDAKNKGLDPAECVGTSLTDLSALPASSLETASTCLASKTKEISDVFDKKTEEINSVPKEITLIENKINKCKKQTPSLQAACLAKVTAHIEAKLISLPNKVNSAVSGIAKSVPKIIADLAKCETLTVDGVRSSGNAIVKKVTDCINKL